MKLKLLNKKQEAENVVSFVFESDTSLTWQAGQYLHYVLPHANPDDRGEERWFTVSAAPHEGHVMVTTRFVPGDGSTFKQTLQKLEVGQTVEADGPEGDFVVDPTREFVFIAGGIGITPFRSILLDLDFRHQPIKGALFYGNRDNNIVFKEELEMVARKNPNLKIHYIINPEKIDEDRIRLAIPDLSQPIFYVSGPKPMVEAMAKTLTSMGVASDHIKLDDFPGYPLE